MHNLPHIDGADELIVPLNVVEGGLASPNDTAPDDPSNAESNGQLPKGAQYADVLRRYYARQGKSVASRLGAGETDPDALLDAARWDAELAADLVKAGATAPLASDMAQRINTTTRIDLAKALIADDPTRAAADLFARYVSAVGEDRP
jgi:hypothetical protein